MIEFEKGYMCFWDVNCPCIWKCEPTKDNESGVVKYQWGSADYCQFTKKEVQEWNELGKWQSVNGHWCDVEEFIDHHNMLCAEEDCAFGDTPQEALRLFLIKTKDRDFALQDMYVRKNNRFYYLNDCIDNKEEWDAMLKDAKTIFVYCIGIYSNCPEMEEIALW